MSNLLSMAFTASGCAVGIVALQYKASRKNPLTPQEEAVLRIALLGQGMLGALAAQLCETDEERWKVVGVVSLTPPAYAFSAALYNIVERFTFFLV